MVWFENICVILNAKEFCDAFVGQLLPASLGSLMEVLEEEDAEDENECFRVGEVGAELDC